jgi:hypothetical protein
MLRSRSPMRLHLGAAGVAWLVLAGGAGGAPAADEGGKRAASPGRLEVALDQGALSVRAAGVPLAAVLGAIAARAGFALSVRGALDAPVSVTLAEVPLEDGLRQLLGRGSFVFLYDHPGADPTRKLVEVRGQVSEEAAALPGRDRAADVPAPHDDADVPAISPYDHIEDRLEFARIEARAGRPKSAEDLVTLLLEDEHAGVRGLAASALGRLGGAEAGEALIEALADRDRRVRRRAARALGEARGGQAVAPLAALLAEERAREVRRVAAYTLSRIDGEAARRALKPLQRDHDPQMRRIATFALEAAED